MYYVSQLDAEVAFNNARIIDVDTYEVAGQRLFSAVMIENTGADMKDWWLDSNVDDAFIQNALSVRNARFIDLEDRGGGMFTVVMQEREGKSSWRYFGVDADRVNNRIGQNGARLIDIEPYLFGGQPRYMCVMLNNSNALTSTVGSLVRSNISNGDAGFYLKRVNGPVLASLHDRFVWYPASTIKVMHHLHAMLRVEVEDNGIDLNTVMTVYPNASDSCSTDHTGQPFVNEPLSTSLQLIMEQSDNQRTNAIQEFFTQTLINATAHDFVGMSNDTNLNHKLACGGPGSVPPNIMTLPDITLLYEKVVLGEIFALESTRVNFYNLMLDSNTWLDTLINEETPVTMDAPTLAQFKAGIRIARKPGSIPANASGQEWATYAGWVRLPTHACQCEAPREYAFGVFFNQVVMDPAITTKIVVEEMLRGEVRQAMLDYQACFERPGDITLDGMVNVTDLLQLLAAWGLCDPVGPCPSDIAPSGGDGTVMQAVEVLPGALDVRV
ncbi:MAG: serine hydrolase [Planctomycetes bacterium]|nr:serine hydrolase [Planctomycetota bacterium]